MAIEICKLNISEVADFSENIILSFLGENGWIKDSRIEKNAWTIENLHSPEYMKRQDLLHLDLYETYRLIFHRGLEDELYKRVSDFAISLDVYYTPHQKEIFEFRTDIFNQTVLEDILEGLPLGKKSKYIYANERRDSWKKDWIDYYTYFESKFTEAVRILNEKNKKD